MASVGFELPRPRFGLADLERPTAKRVDELLASSDPIGADLVLRAMIDRDQSDRRNAADRRSHPLPDDGTDELRMRVATQRGDPVRTIAAADDLLARAPGGPRAPEVRLRRAQALHQLGRLQEALDGARSARASATAAGVQKSGKGASQSAGAVSPATEVSLESQRLEMQVLVRARRLDEARALLRAWASQPPMRLLAELHAGEIALLEGDADAARTQLAPLVASERVPAMVRWSAAFHLVRACERLGDFDGAFAAATAGNALPHPAFDADAFDRSTEAIVARFDARFIAETPVASVKDERPVFVVGLPRSGTSLLEQIIASHPRAGGVGERQQADAIAENLDRLAAVRRGLPTVDDLDREARDYLDMFRACGVDRERVVNKALGLERHLGWLSRVLPGMRVLRIDRDPRDCLLSIHQHPLSPTRHPWTCALGTLVRAHRGFTRLMDHWARTLPVPMLEVRYESLVDRPDEEIERIIRFLGLEPHPACLRFHESVRVVLTPSQDQVREPMNRAGIGRWKRYERHLAPLLAAFPD